MRKIALEYRRPQYAIDSVDNALRAIHILRDTESARVSDIVKALGVAHSTAHRIMAMLVYQGFAVQDDHRRYHAGPALSAPVIRSALTKYLQDTAMPIARALSDDLGETVHLSVRVGLHTRVLLSMLSTDSTHQAPQAGAVLPAHSSAAGRALLALESKEFITKMYRGSAAEAVGSDLSDSDFRVLLIELENTRRRGFALCAEEVNLGASAVAVPVVTVDAPPTALVVGPLPSRLMQLVEDRTKIARVFAARDDLVEAFSAGRRVEDAPAV